eukprot:Skav216799  [mRNA]  locus=scaffold2110:38009:39750:- [translate_table: standard]
MEDTDAHIEDAVEAAEKVAAYPFLCEILQMSGSGAELHLMSDEAMARLLKLITSDTTKEVAAHVSRNHQLQPIRRWNVNELFDLVKDNFEKYSKVLIAALREGVDFERGEVCCGNFLPNMPLPVALFRWLEMSQWQQLEEFFPESQKKWTPELLSIDVGFSKHFNCQPGCPCPRQFCFCISKIQSADRAGIDISAVRISFLCRHRESPVHKLDLGATLLGAAILCGQSDCAIACVRRGVRATGLDVQPYRRDNKSTDFFIKKFLDDDKDIRLYVDLPCCNEPMLLGTGPNCNAAACAAGKAAVRLDAAEKQVAICQVLMQMFAVNEPPKEVVHSIVTFSVRVPQFVDELGLADLVEGWLMHVPGSKVVTEDAHVTQEWQSRNQSEESQDVTQNAQEIGIDPTAESEQASADADSTEKLLTAVQASRSEVPALNVHGVSV